MSSTVGTSELPRWPPSVQCTECITNGFTMKLVTIGASAASSRQTFQATLRTSLRPNFSTHPFLANWTTLLAMTPDLKLRYSELANTPSPSGGESPYPDLTQIPLVQLIFFILYILVMLSALVGNLLVSYTVLSNRKMQTVVNCYIVNLAVCDFLIGVFVLPTKLLELLAPAEWSALDDTMCTVMFFLQTVLVFASVLTLVATCFERYFAIVHPLKSRMQQSKSRTCRILVAVWILSCSASLPNLYNQPKALVSVLSSDYGTISRQTCMPNFEPNFRVPYFTILFVGFYVIPLSLISFTSFCIARSLLKASMLHRQGSLLRQEVNRRKVGKMILIVVLTFTIAWTPYFLISVITQYQQENFMNKHDYYFTMLCINLFAFLHSSINPVIYATMSARFRKGFREILRMVLCCESPPPQSFTGQTSLPEPGTSSRGSHNVRIVTVNNVDEISMNDLQVNQVPPRQHQPPKSVSASRRDDQLAKRSKSTLSVCQGYLLQYTLMPTDQHIDSLVTL